MTSQGDLKLVEVENGAEFEVEVEGLDVFFPDHVDGWSDVLDCRIPPYTEQTLDEIRDFASHVRKTFVLVKAD